MSISKVIENFLNDRKEKIIKRADRKKQNESKKVGNSLYVKSGRLRWVLASTFEWIWQAWEYGRGKTRPGTGAKYGSGKTLREAIERMLRKQGKNKKEVKTIAWFISQKIHLKGTLLKRGLDERFSGKQSSTITDFTNKKGVIKDLTPLIKDDLIDTIIQTYNR